MPWLALPFSERERKGALSSKFGVRGIPSLIVLEAETGKVIVPPNASLVFDMKLVQVREKTVEAN